MVRHEVPLSRVQHHAIPDQSEITHRRSDRPEANAPAELIRWDQSAGCGRYFSGYLGPMAFRPGRRPQRRQDPAALACKPRSRWRRWGDSNSRGASTPTSLAGRRTRPLCDISITLPRRRRGTRRQPTGRMPLQANRPTTCCGHLDMRHPDREPDGRPAAVTHGPKSPDQTIRGASGLTHWGHGGLGSTQWRDVET